MARVNFVPSAEEILKDFTYDPDEGVLRWAGRNQKVAGAVHPGGYRRLMWRRRRYYAHRLVARLVFGELPLGLVVDHIDGNGMNNKADNLRLVTQSSNLRNSRMSFDNSSGVSGISWCRRKSKWVVRFHTDAGYKSFGYFSSIDVAKCMLDKMRPIHGYTERHGT